MTCYTWLGVNFLSKFQLPSFYVSLEDQVGLRLRRPVNNGLQEGGYSAWVAWRKGKFGLPGLSFLPPLSLSPRLPRQSSPPPVAHYLQGALGLRPNSQCFVCQCQFGIDSVYRTAPATPGLLITSSPGSGASAMAQTDTGLTDITT